MNDREIEQMLRRVRPAVPPSAHYQAGQELLEEIMAQTAKTDETELEATEMVPTDVLRQKRVRWLVGVAAAVAVALAIALPMTLFQRSGAVVPAAELPEEALTGKGNPHLFLDDARWPMEWLNQSSAMEGEETFIRDGSASLSVNWSKESTYAGMFDDRVVGDGKPEKITVFDVEASLFHKRNESYELFLPPREGGYVVIRGDGLADRQSFLNLLGSLRQLSPDEWHAALPGNMVTPRRSSAVAQEMLRDVPVPENFDKAALGSDLANQDYHFAVNVLSTVTCAWLDDYTRARADGDEETMAAVATALSGSRNWAVVKTMDQEGDWSPTVHTYADRVAKGESVAGYRKSFECGEVVLDE